jgi:hypothetical protein
MIRFGAYDDNSTDHDDDGYFIGHHAMVIYRNIAGDH